MICVVWSLRTSSSLLSFIPSDALSQTGRRVNESTAQMNQRGFEMIVRRGVVRRRSFAPQKREPETDVVLSTRVNQSQPESHSVGQIKAAKCGGDK